MPNRVIEKDVDVQHHIIEPFDSNGPTHMLAEVHTHITAENVSGGPMSMKDMMVDDLGEYHGGLGYYELIKDELVQATKVVVIQDVESGRVFSGPHIRQLLGLPTNGKDDVKFSPRTYKRRDRSVAGFPTRYRVYVQSKASNRKILKGQFVLYAFANRG